MINTETRTLTFVVYQDQIRISLRLKVYN